GNEPFAVGREAAKRCRVRNSETLPPGLEVPYGQGVEFVPPERGQFLAVGRKHQRADDLCLAGQLEGVIAPRQLPEMSPFEAAKVRFPRPREVALQEVKCLGKVASLPVVVRLAQVGRVGLPPGDSLEPTQVDRSR